MKIGIMQPYFLAYIGYWQLLNLVDKYVLYDNIEFTKKGWINKNRLLCNGTDKLFSIPLKKASDYLDVKERFISDTYDRKLFLKQIDTYYHRAPYFEEIYPLMKEIIMFEKDILFEYIEHSIRCICEYLDIKTEIIISSTLQYDNNLKGQDKVLAICQALNATEYYNSIGGTKLYDSEEFEKREISLKFLQADFIEYKQFQNEFVSNLSILDVLMFNSRDTVKGYLSRYSLIEFVQ